MNTNFKELWEELTELLEKMEVPRVLWHCSDKLKDHILLECPIAQFDKAPVRALEILYELYPAFPTK